MAHHGSDTSTSDAFLSAVSPDYAVISVGQDNDYGHPCQVTLDRLETAGADIFRTDLMGTVIAYSDGTHLSFSAESDPAQSGMDASADSSSFLWDTEETGIYAAQSGEGTDESAAETEEDIQVHITKAAAGTTEKGAVPLKIQIPSYPLTKLKAGDTRPVRGAIPRNRISSSFPLFTRRKITAAATDSSAARTRIVQFLYVSIHFVIIPQEAPAKAPM